jgi:hypothetical protein
VEGTQTLEGLSTGLLQVRVPGDDVNDARALAQSVDVFFSDLRHYRPLIARAS